MPPLKPLSDILYEVWYSNWWLIWIIILIFFMRRNLIKTDKAFAKYGWLLIVFQSLVWGREGIWYQMKYGFDFPIYYHAALGEFDWLYKRGSVGGMGETIGWVYKDWTAITWKPFTLLNIETATMVWSIIGILALLYTWNKVRKVRYGATLFSVLLPFTVVSQISGNIQTELIALCLTPLGAVVAGLYKPYCFLFAGIYALRFGYYQARIRYPMYSLKKRLSRPPILHNKEDNMI